MTTVISLKRTALVWMTILLALVGLATAVISYRLAYDQAAEFLDGQLRQVALNAGIEPRAAAAPAFDQDPEDELAVTIWNADGAMAHTSPPDVTIPRQARKGFAERHDRWRALARLHGQR